MSRRRWAVAVTLNDTEVRISLHPISLAKLLAECIEDAADTWCRRRGHDELPDGHCARCGRSLPDNQTPYGAWLPTAYRAITTPTDTSPSDGAREDHR